MNNYIICSYFTPEYKDVVTKLIGSLETFHLPHIVEEVPSRKHWYLNVAIRPEFILDIMQRFPDKDVVYTDADSEIMQYPKLFDTIKCDLGAHYLNGTQLLGGTMYLRNCPEIHRLLKNWIEAQWRDFRSLRQRILQGLLESENYNIDIQSIPSEYVRIFDRHKMGKAVIQHNQASRKFKGVFRMGVRHLPDGTIILTRKDANLEKLFDMQFTRVGKLKWIPKMLDDNKVESLESIFKNKTAYIIGKGPSLDNLTADAFADESSPILAINESITKIESLSLPNPTFLMVYDMKKYKVKNAGVIVPSGIKYLYNNRPTYSYNTSQLKLKIKKSLTALFAIEICKSLGVKDFHMISFDSCINKNTEYAKCVGRKSNAGGRDPKRFLRHKALITKLVDKIPLTWILPFDGQHPQS